MKTIIRLIIICKFITLALLLFLWGCSYPLVIQHGGQTQVAPVLGVEESDIRFLRYAFFMNTPPDESVDTTRGIVALTDSDLFLIEGNLRTMTSSTETRIPISDMEGLFLSDQIQLKLGESGMVIWVVTSDPKLDLPGLDHLHDLLNAEGIPAWQCEQEYALRELRSNTNGRNLDTPPNFGQMQPIRTTGGGLTTPR